MHLPKWCLFLMEYVFFDWATSVRIFKLSFTSILFVLALSFSAAVILFLLDSLGFLLVTNIAIFSFKYLCHYKSSHNPVVSPLGEFCEPWVSSCLFLPVTDFVILMLCHVCFKVSVIFTSALTSLSWYKSFMI